jgi:hypothetical protein
MYIRSQSAATAAGLAVTYMDSPPVLFSLGALNMTIDTAELATGNLTIDLGNVLLDNTWAATGGKLLVEISLPANPGRQFPGPKWQSAGLVTGAAAGTSTLVIPVAGLSFPPAVGQIIWLRVRGIGPSTDRRVSTQQILGPEAVVAG